MTTLVTGATGFVGRRVVARLHAQGADVHATSRSPRPGWLPEDVAYSSADLMRSADRRALIEEARPERLVHLAWNAVPGEFWTSPDNLDWVGATLGLLRAFGDSGGRRAVLVGSCAEYEWGQERPLSEEDPAGVPTSLYGVAKTAAGMVAEAYGRTSGCSLARARLFFVFGEGEPRGKFVTSVAEALLDGRGFELTGASHVRDFVHVDDVAEALVLILGSDLEGPVNVGTGAGTSVRELAAMIAGAAGSPHLVTEAGGAAEAPPVVADIRRLQSLGWSPQPLSARVAQTVAQLGSG